MSGLVFNSKVDPDGMGELDPMTITGSPLVPPRFPVVNRWSPAD